MLQHLTNEQLREIKKKLEEFYSLGDIDDFHATLKKYTGIEARPYTAYLYYDANGDFIGDSNTSLEELLGAAYLEVNDG